MSVGRSCCGRWGPGVLESGFQLDALVGTYIADCMYTELQLAPDLPEVESSWDVMAHGDARERKWRGNWRMEWVASTLHTTSEHGVSSITTADAHTSAASSRLNWRPRQFIWTRPFRRKTKSGFCACAITFQLASNCYVSRGGPEQQIWRHDMCERRKQLTQTYPTRKNSRNYCLRFTPQWKCPRTMGTTEIIWPMKERKRHKRYALQTFRNCYSERTHAFVMSRNDSTIYIILYISALPNTCGFCETK